MTKYHILGSYLITNRYRFLAIPESGKSKIKVPIDSVSGDSPLPGL